MSSTEIVKESLNVKYIKILNFPLHLLIPYEEKSIINRFSEIDQIFKFKDTVLNPYVEDICIANKTSEYIQARILFILKDPSYEQTILYFFGDLLNNDSFFKSANVRDTLHYVEINERNSISVDLYMKDPHLSIQDELIYNNGQIIDRRDIFKILPFKSGNRLYWGMNDDTSTIKAIMTKERVEPKVVIMPLADIDKDKEEG